MAFTPSLAPEVEDALITQLQARAGLSGVQVDIGPLGNDTDAYETVQSLGATAEQEWGDLGNRLRKERPELEIVIYVEKPGSGAGQIRACRDRAYELFGEIEQQLRDDPKINGTALENAQIVRQDATDRGVTPRGRYQVIRVFVEARTRLPRV